MKIEVCKSKDTNFSLKSLFVYVFITSSLPVPRTNFTTQPQTNRRRMHHATPASKTPTIGPTHPVTLSLTTANEESRFGQLLMADTNARFRDGEVILKSRESDISTKSRESAISLKSREETKVQQLKQVNIVCC